MLNTRIKDMFKIKYPIIQGGMAWIATSELAIAVSEAGGLGIIGCGSAPVEVIREEIRKVKEKTNKPFGINIMLMSPHAEEIAELLYKERVPVITTGAGNPGKHIEKWKSNGSKTVPVVPTVALARRMEKMGADALIVEGTEAGGHIGELTLMSLLPQVVDAVDIPVIGAGGIADGRGLLAALALGAEGVQIGTRFICSTESIAHKNYKEKIISAKDRDAIVTGRTTGHPVRSLKNKLTKRLLEAEKDNESIEEILKLGEGALERAAIKGEVDEGSLMAGQSSGLINNILPCKEIIENMVTVAKHIYEEIK